MRRRHARIVLGIVQSVALLSVAMPGVLGPRLYAWGVEGHHVIGRIALTLLAPDTKRAVQDLLGADDFVAVSTWADDIRSERPETYNWHFVNIPYSEQTYVASRDCAPTPRGDCLIAELERARRAMIDVSAGKTERAEALKYLIHFLGDLHQPLHTIDNHDRGGNDVHVLRPAPSASGSDSMTLHAVWDAMPVHDNAPGEEAYAQSLIQDLKVQYIATSPIDFAKWAESTHQIAVEYVYDYRGFSPNGPPAAPITLSDDYRRRAKLAVEHQVELAGVRLAAVLNQAFRGQK